MLVGMKFIVPLLAIGLTKTIFLSREKAGFSFVNKWDISTFFSAPFLFFTLFFAFLWPGTLEKPVIIGSLEVLSGFSLLFFSYVIMENSRYSDLFFHLKDPMVGMPREFLPLFAKWELPEDVLAGLFVSLPVASRIRQHGFLEAALILGLGFAVINVPVFVLVALEPWRKSRGNGIGIRPRLFKSIIGMACVLMVCSSLLYISSGVHYIIGLV